MALSNWAGNVEFCAARIHRPGNLAQLQAVVAGAPAVRALGSGHSFNRIADCSADLVLLTAMPAIRMLDAAAGTVTVDAGARYGDVARWLHVRGYALHNLGSLPHISVGGACATGTHGSGDGNGSLATAVSAIELVTASGELVALSRAADPATFEGAVVALGALGILTSLTLDIAPAYQLRQCVFEGLEFDRLTDNIEAILASAYSVSVFTTWRAEDRQQVWCKGLLDEAMPEPGWLGTVPADGPRHPIPGIDAANATEQLGVPGDWHRRLPHFRLDFMPSSGDELQSEYLLPRHHAAAALVALDAIRDRIAPLLLISEIRSIAADQLWLSPSYGRATVALHFTWVNDEDALRPVVAAVEAILAAHDARPHWGKVFGGAAHSVAARYDRWEDFRGLMQAFDPDRKFRNDWMAALFG